MTTTEPLTNTTSAPIQGELRDGIAIDKGVVITEDFLEEHEQLFKDYNSYFLLYPDL